MTLTGKRILITRPRPQASELAAQLEAAGAETLLVPTIEVAPPDSFCALDAALACLRSFDWTIFTSANAVHAFHQRATVLSLTPNPKRIAVVGPATARAVQEIGLTVNLMPPVFVAEALAGALLPHAAQTSMLLVRAEIARDLLPETLTAAGAVVTIANAYRTVIPAGSVEMLQQLFSSGRKSLDAVTFTSSSTATNLFALLGAAGLPLPEEIVRASIGPITSQTLRELGSPPHVEAEEATISSLCHALKSHFAARTNPRLRSGQKL